MVKGLYNLDTFHILDNNTVDVVICLHISGVLAVIVPHKEKHRYHGQHRRNQDRQSHAPVDNQHPDKNCNRE